MKNIICCLLALFAVCAMTSCEKESAPTKIPETQLSEIDMSSEEEDEFYTYFRFVNETGVPISIEYVKNGSDIGTIHYVASYRDAVDRHISETEFVAFKDCIWLLRIYYNITEESSNSDYIKVECSEGGLLDYALWSREEIDANSLVSTFVVTEKMYEEANK